jgi:tight adherence protein B
MELLIGSGVFLCTLLLIMVGHYYGKMLFRPEQKKLHRRLKILAGAGQQGPAIDILKKRTLSEIPWLNEALLKASFIPRLEALHSQSRANRPIGFFVILSAVLFIAGFIIAHAMRINPVAVVLPSVFLAAAPFLYLVRKRRKRMKKFESQLPEALDLVARSLKAGLAFTGGLRMVAEEFGDPIGVEFAKAVDEINFGMAVPEALMNMTRRIENEDLKFFAVAVIVQRETGGNLSEILEGLSRLIRERFKFQGRVRVLAAEGRMSATVLMGLPFFLVGLLSILDPEYIGVLFSDPIGMLIIACSLVMMSFGGVIIKKLVEIKA